MAAKKWVSWALLAVVSLTCGCCRFCDRWCGPHTAAAPAASCCCVPCCHPGTVAGAAPAVPAAGWNQPAPVTGVCVPCVPAR